MPDTGGRILTSPSMPQWWKRLEDLIMWNSKPSDTDKRQYIRDILGKISTIKKPLYQTKKYIYDNITSWCSYLKGETGFGIIKLMQ